MVPSLLCLAHKTQYILALERCVNLNKGTSRRCNIDEGEVANYTRKKTKENYKLKQPGVCALHSRCKL